MFLHTELETLLPYFDKLTAETKPLWGSMTAQRMVEHLTDTLLIACGENPQSLVIPEDKIPGMLRFLDSDKPMAKETHVHPYYGPLNHDQWTRLHSKHVTHHFTQFELI